MKLSDLPEPLRALILEKIPRLAKVDPGKVEVEAQFTLEKFDGEIEPGKKPVEVLAGGTDKPTRLLCKDGQPVDEPNPYGGRHITKP